MTATIRQARLLCQSLFPPILDIELPIPGPRVIAAAARLLGVVPVQRRGPHAALQDGHRECRGDAAPTEPARRCCRSSSNVSATPNATSAAELPSIAAAVHELQPEAELVPKLQPQFAIREDDGGCESCDISADAAATAHRLFYGEKVSSGIADGGGTLNGTTDDK